MIYERKRFYRENSLSPFFAKMQKLAFGLATVECDQHAGEWASPGGVIHVQARSAPLTLCPTLVWLRAPREVCSRALGHAVF
jgi:hypothetical protein